jgi:hypothetical protein
MAGFVLLIELLKLALGIGGLYRSVLSGKDVMKFKVAHYPNVGAQPELPTSW